MATRKVLHTLMVAGTVLCLLLLVTPFSFADSHARIVRLSDIEGGVQIDRNTGNGFEKAIMNMPITEGMRLETGSSGRAEIEFENGTVVRLADHSSVEFTQLSLRSDGQRVSEVRVNDGTAYVNYKHKGGDEFRLDAANQALNLNHDVHFRLRLSRGDAEIAVFKGELEVPGNGQMAKVKKDETFNLDLNDGGRYTLAKGISSFESDEWDSQRTDYNTQYAANYNRNQVPYQYGYSDLNYYGSFFNAPGYGTLWRPFGASAMFDPFGDGAWAYYPSYGYMWVSGYPWGWTPYRYGSWIYVPTYGWAWQPGGWNNWNPYPVVVNAPPTWHHPTPPPVRGNGSTVIVGNPILTRPLRPTINNGGPVRSVVGGRGGINSPTSVPIDRPGRAVVPGTTSTTATPATTVTTDRPSRSQVPSTSQNATSAQPATTTPPLANTSRPTRSVNSENLPAAKSQQVQVDRGSRPSVSPTPPTTSPTPAPRPAPAPVQRPATPKTSSMQAPHSSGMSGASMHSAGSMSAAPHASTSSSRPSSKH